ncbi:MAG: hypothetical protein M1839_002202 [Geoglossum umbratile]|nr:MAG: hypothetical protein M1839_002202 [Geoglossum umbratile]
MLRPAITVPRLAGLVCAIALLHVVWLYRRSVVDWQSRQFGGTDHQPAEGGGGDSAEAEELIAAGNKTLGFGEILVISLDYRTDRQDALSLVGDLSGLNFTMLRGVPGEETLKSPAVPSDTALRPAELGCWRSHVNAWKHVLESGVETALILEDDADWHVNIKDQMRLLSQNMMRHGSPLLMPNGGTEMVKEKGKEGVLAPYTLDWDIFWVGQCVQANNREGGKRPGFTYKDTAGPYNDEPQSDFKEELLIHGVDYDKGEKSMRVVAEASGPACTTGYAVTRTGAHRLLYNLGYLGPQAPVDLQLLSLCARRELRTIWIAPPLISSWVIGTGPDSDTKNTTERIDDPNNPAKGASKIGEGSARREVAKLWGVGDNKVPRR